MGDKALRVLVIEGDPGYIELLEEAFAEMEETSPGAATGVCERLYVLDPEEAFHKLRDSRYDAILQDIECGERRGLPSFLRLHATSPAVPIVVLVRKEEAPLGLSLVRQGAQDYLLLEDLDCRPLAHALRCSIERNRLWQAQRSVSLTDDLTGLYNNRGFLQLAGREIKVAQWQHLHALVEAVWWDQTAAGLDAQQHDLAVIQIAEGMRELSGETGILARWSDRCFVMLSLAANAEQCAVRTSRFQTSLRALERSAANQIRGLHWSSVLWGPGDSAGVEELVELAMKPVCENNLVANRAGRHL